MIIYDFESKGWVELVSLKPASKRVESHFDTVNRKSDNWFCTYIAYIAYFVPILHISFLDIDGNYVTMTFTRVS